MVSVMVRNYEFEKGVLVYSLAVVNLHKNFSRRVKLVDAKLWKKFSDLLGDYRWFLT